MNGEDEYDLSGEWKGIYSYPRHLPPNTFEASIRDNGGIISGVIRQGREVIEPPGGPQHAVIDGSRQGSHVRWVKVYDDLTRETPHYTGTIQPGGEEIAGEWHIPGDWSGTFLTVRARKAKAEQERKVSEQIGNR